jgi:hypothetical protein
MGYVQPLQKIKNSPGGRFIQVAGWFVGQQEPRAPDQSPCQRDALLLSARELSGPVFAAVFQVDLLKPIRCHIQRLSTPSSARHQGHRHVLNRRKLR